MDLLEAANAGAGRAYPVNESVSREVFVVVWGTVVTAVDLEYSPDGGTTWISLAAFSADAVATVRFGGKGASRIRGNVTTGTAVNMRIF